MKRFIATWLARPQINRKPLHVFTEYCGYFYLLVGVLFLLIPGVPVDLGLIPRFQGQEEGLVRLLGLTIGLIGYFYVFGARTHSDAFGLSTVVDRLLVPFLIGFVVFISDVALMLVLPLAIIDPILALIALLLWKRQQSKAEELVNQ